MKTRKNIQIILTNANTGQLKGDFACLQQLFLKFKIKHPDAWYALTKSNVKWDGYVKYISSSGFFKVGLLKQVYEEALKLTDDVEIIDRRPKLSIKPVIPSKMGDLTLYPDQKQALKQLLNYKVGGIPFTICSANLPVNFGKTLIFTSIHKAYKSKLRTLLLLNDSDLFNQFKKEIPLLLPDEEVTFIRGNKVMKWTQFNVAMVQSLAGNLKKYDELLNSVDITLIDEADVMDSKTYKSVIEKLYNTQIRIGLSGTLYKGKLKKHILKNMNIKSFIGEMVSEIKLSDQIKKGRSTPLVVKCIMLKYPVTPGLSYQEQYQEVVVDNPYAYEVILKRIKYNLKFDRVPMLIATKFIPHTERLEQYLQKHLPDLRVKGVHHKTPKRKEILESFRIGDIDILIATTIISRGKNIPLLKYTCNASSMDAEEKTIQLIGRSARIHKLKNKAVIDDLIFPGNYLTKHGKHRKNYYLRENLKVISIPRSKTKKRKRKSINKSK